MQTGRFNKNHARLIALLAMALVVGISLANNNFQAAASAPTQMAAPKQASKVETAVLEDTANGKATSFIALMAEQADVSKGYSMRDEDARGWYVYNTLKSVADRSQAPLKALLDSRKVQYKSYWAANILLVYGDRSVVDMLAARSDVKAIESNRSFKAIDDPVAVAAPDEGKIAAPNTVEWGVQRVNAPQVWAMGYTGQNIVVGNQDTGMRWTHLAIKPHYRGWNGSSADHNYNWHDSIHSGGGVCGPNSTQPCDDSGHGTHTTGTTTGDDGSGNQVGVAPGAKWIGCRNMDQGTGTPATYTECFQFFIAPTDLNGNNPDPTKRPHVMNNSWGCPTSEGCAAGTLETIVNNTQAAGIFVEVSAGNSGPGCSSVTDPPALYAASFSTGAIDINNTLAGFSSRGPSTYYSPNLLKPNISAPGVNVRSSYYSSDTSYASLSGTSMAGPHVVGVVALLWSARPQLSRMITETKQILQNTANPNVVVSPVQTCGGIPSSQIPNNSFGYGRVDALAAVNSVPQETATPTVTGTPPTATNTPSVAPATNTPTATATACASSAIVNGGFETGSLPPWTVLGTNPAPTVRNTGAHSGTYAAFLGNDPGAEPTGDSSMYQQITVPASGGTLSFWWNGYTEDTITFDWQDAYITNTSGQILATIMHNCQTTGTYVNQTFNMAPYAGQTIRIEFLVHQDGFGDVTNMYLDDVQLITACSTGTVVATNTPPPTNTSTATVAPTNTQPAASATSTSQVATATGTQGVATATATSGAATETSTQPAATQTESAATETSTQPAATNTVAPTATTCSISFTDVPPGSTFYTWIQCLACRGIISGYPDGSFRPNAEITRGQISKMVALSAGYHEGAGTQVYEDVPPGSPFEVYVNEMSRHGVMGGYPCGTRPDEPCVPPANRPYFRPSENASRGALAKIASNAAGYTENHTSQTFEDVGPSHPYYLFVERLATRNVMQGYACGQASNEPCVPPGNRPYFRPYATVTRGQASKIVANTFFPGCNPQAVK